MLLILSRRGSASDPLHLYPDSALSAARLNPRSGQFIDWA